VRVIHTIEEVRRALDDERRRGARIGFVPTMGALHAGHRALVERAWAECDRVAASIFVNPLQFGASEDLSRYPRTLDADVAMIASAGGGVVFAPSVAEMYPAALATSVTVSDVAARLEGAARPGHFDGVATVVAKLFNIVGPCVAYFGEKDWQQLAVVRAMVADLSVPVEVVGCPTVRDADGLALSSRNAYLSSAERAAAPTLYRALQHGVQLVAAGERDPEVVNAAMAAMISAVARLDYAVIVKADTLEAVQPLAGQLRLLVAARFDSARLIDNVGVVAP
jgi:pantoate--beta-alanine ligase